MKKKRRIPQPERSAFESARAALERAGEEPETSEDDTKTFVALAKPESTSAPENADAETVGDAQASEPDMEASKPETEGNAQLPAPGNAEASEPETAPLAVAASAGAETADKAEAVTSENAEASAPEIAEAFAPVGNAEMPASETPDNAEASAPETEETAQTSAPEVAENAGASAPIDSASAPETGSENISAPTGETAGNAAPLETPAPEAVEGAPNPEPSDAESLTAEAETSDFEASEPFPDADDGSGADAEIAETERHTMQTKEITVGYRRQRTEGGTEAAKERKGRGTKSPFKALNQLKDAIQGEQDGYGDDAPPSGSPRDAALRKRVMQIEDDETRNYLLDRVLPQMTWYSKRSAQYRTMYYRLMAATIFLGALIPVFSVGGGYGAVKVIIALLGASVTAVNAYIALHNYHDLWITYQKTREDLIHTLYCYFNNAGVFSQKKMPQKDLNVLLVDVCEDTLSKENGGWTTIVQKT